MILIDVETCHSRHDPPHSTFRTFHYCIEHFAFHSTSYTPHFILQTLHCTVDISNPQSTLYNLHFTLHCEIYQLTWGGQTLQGNSLSVKSAKCPNDHHLQSLKYPSLPAEGHHGRRSPGRFRSFLAEGAAGHRGTGAEHWGMVCDIVLPTLGYLTKATTSHPYFVFLGTHL